MKVVFRDRLGSVPIKFTEKKKYKSKNDAIKLREQSSVYEFLYISHAFEDDHVQKYTRGSYKCV